VAEPATDVRSKKPEVTSQLIHNLLLLFLILKAPTQPKYVCGKVSSNQTKSFTHGDTIAFRLFGY
jgi:hypothetical protein